MYVYTFTLTFAEPYLYLDDNDLLQDMDYTARRVSGREDNRNRNQNDRNDR